MREYAIPFCLTWSEGEKRTLWVVGCFFSTSEALQPNQDTLECTERDADRWREGTERRAAMIRLYAIYKRYQCGRQRQTPVQMICWSVKAVRDTIRALWFVWAGQISFHSQSLSAKHHSPQNTKRWLAAARNKLNSYLLLHWSFQTALWRSFWDTKRPQLDPTRHDTF